MADNWVNQDKGTNQNATLFDAYNLIQLQTKRFGPSFF